MITSSPSILAKCIARKKVPVKKSVQSIAGFGSVFKGVPILQTLYVQRKLYNPQPFIDWAKSQGFPSVLAPEELHVTIVYSKAPVSWDALPPDESPCHSFGGIREIIPLGSEGAVVLKFPSKDLADRHQQWAEAGASWDYESYQSHVTISYDAASVDLSKVKPYTGVLEFGPEIYEPLEENWKAMVVEKGAPPGNDNAAGPHKMHRGVGDESSSSGLLTWVTPDKEIAQGYANHRTNGRVETVDAKLENTLDLGHEGREVTPSQFAIQAMTKAKESGKSNLSDKEMMKLRADFIKDQPNKTDKMIALWADEGGKKRVSTLLTGLGFDSVHLAEEGKSTYGLLKKSTQSIAGFGFLFQKQDRVGAPDGNDNAKKPHKYPEERASPGEAKKPEPKPETAEFTGFPSIEDYEGQKDTDKPSKPAEDDSFSGFPLITDVEVPKDIAQSVNLTPHGEKNHAELKELYARGLVIQDPENFGNMPLDKAADLMAKHYPTVTPHEVVDGLFGKDAHINGAMLSINQNGFMTVVAGKYGESNNTMHGTPIDAMAIEFGSIRNHAPQEEVDNVHHSFMRVVKGKEGEGASKKQFADIVPLYRKMGKKTLDLDANLEGGVHAWGRYGAHAKNPKEYRAVVGKMLDEFEEKIKGHMTPEAHAEMKLLRTVMDSLQNDPRIPRLVTNMPLPHLDKATVASGQGSQGEKSKFLSSGTRSKKSWEGYFDLHDEEQMKHLAKYIGNKSVLP